MMFLALQRLARVVSGHDAVVGGMPGTMTIGCFLKVSLLVGLILSSLGVSDFRALDVGSCSGRMLPLWMARGAVEAVGLEITEEFEQPRTKGKNPKRTPTSCSIVWGGMLTKLLLHPEYHRFGDGITNNLGVDAAALANYSGYLGGKNQGMPVVAYVFGFSIPEKALTGIFKALNSTPEVCVVAVSAALEPHSMHYMQREEWRKTHLPGFKRWYQSLSVTMSGSKEHKHFYFFYRCPTTPEGSSSM